MAIAIEGTPAVDGYQSAAVSFTCNLPASIQAGELLIIDAICGDKNKWLDVSGWTTVQISHSTFSRNIIWKKAVGDEGASVTVDVMASGTADAHLSSFRMSGVDTTDPFNSNNSYDELLANTSTPTILANLLTITADSGILAGIACEASRAVSVYDADLDIEVVMSAGLISNHVYLDITEASTLNPAYDFTMSDSRAFDIDLIELMQARTVFEQIAQIDVTITVQGDQPGPDAITIPQTGDVNVALGVSSWQTGRDVQTGAINVIMGVNGTQSGAEATISAYKLQDVIFAGPRRFG